MIFTEGNRKREFSFESLDDLHRFVIGPGWQDKPHTYNHLTENEDPKRMIWRGTATWAEALGLLRDGWLGVLAQAKEIVDPLIKRIGSQIEVPRVYTMDEPGPLGVDVPSAVGGDPAFLHMRSSLSPGRGRLFHVAFNIDAGVGVSAEVIRARGAVGCALVMLLERAGRPCRVTAVSCVTDHRGEATYIKARVKDYSQRLDLSKMMFALAHPSMLRRFTFAIQAYDRPYEERLKRGTVPNGGMGNIIDPPLEKSVDLYLTNAVISDNVWVNSDLAKGFLLGELKKQGVRLRREWERR